MVDLEPSTFSGNRVQIQLINPNFDVYNMAEAIYPRPSVFEDRVLVDTRLLSVYTDYHS